MNRKTGLLIGTIGTNPKNVVDFFKKSSVNLDSFSTLYVKLVSNVILESMLLNNKQKNIVNKESFRNTVFDFYSSLKTFEHLDVRVLLSSFNNMDQFKVTTSKPIDVIYFDSLYSSTVIDAFANKYVVNKSKDFQTAPFKVKNNECISTSTEENSNFKEYDYVAMGGTFDRLHIGHKLLLSEAVLRCNKKLTIGVCSDSILNSKTLPEFIDDCDTRIAGVKDFLSDVQPHLDYNIVPIYDIYGPTKEDALLEMIVVSEETVRGAEKINEYRIANGLTKLEVIRINLIEALKKSEYEESKISSSTRRMRLLGELLKPPSSKPNLPAKPYVIGLTGGIASGKSSILEHLRNFGCGCINCDLIAHQMYEIGSTGYQFILETFGPSVLNEDGSVNRKQLGNVVFNDKEKLNQLNNGLWPLVLSKVKEEIQSLYLQNKEVIVIEAALLIQANWTNECHEIWSCIISPEEAIKRLQARNHLSIEEAQTRINSQPQNKEYISNSNVVFCSYWDPNYTKYQVEKAWTNLKKRAAISS
ncbi:bifunctional coenzyme A synthase [Planococcus citri]|uniref:bifunctional coenzyme A synthase n=1 Tax=Planococcus citri TaxID=170843 RepID=UPI0031F751A0